MELNMFPFFGLGEKHVSQADGENI